jgi:transposase
MRPKGTAAELEARRRIAAGLLADGKGIAEVARLVKASVSSVKRWAKAIREGGDEALAAKPHPGPEPRLDDAQLDELCDIVVGGPLEQGYRTNLWTCRRIAEVIKRRFRVTYHPDHVGRLLHALGFSPQKPEYKARERDEEAISRWRREVWPRIKKGRAEKTPALPSSTRAASCSKR